MDLTTIPTRPIPPVLSATTRERVFTHKTYRNYSGSAVSFPGEEPCDWERLAFLGEGILFATVSKLLYGLFKDRKVAPLKQFRVRLMSKEVLSTVTDEYGWMKQVRCSEGDRPNITSSADNRAAVLESYIGGVSFDYGFTKATEWAEDVVITCLRGLLVGEGANTDEVLTMARAAGNKPALTLDTRHKISDQPWNEQLAQPASSSMLPKRNTSDMDVDGEPMDTSESEADFPVSFTSVLSPLSRHEVPVSVAPAPKVEEDDPTVIAVNGMVSSTPPQPPAYSPKDPVKRENNPFMGFSPFAGVPSIPMSPLSVSDAATETFHSFDASPFPQFSAIGSPSTTSSGSSNLFYSPSHPYPYAQASYSLPRHQTSLSQATPPQQQIPSRSNPYFYGPSSSRPRTPPIMTSSYASQQSFYSQPNMNQGPPYPSPSRSNRSSSIFEPAPPPARPPPNQMPDKSRVLTGALARLNERAKTRHEQPEWTFLHEGQGQFITWAAKLFFKSRGFVAEGQGQSKQIAKERAAQAALEKLRWNL